MNGFAVTLLYDGDGNRVAKTLNGVTTRYLVDDLNPTGYTQVVEESVNGSVQRFYSYGLQRIDEIQLVNNTWTMSFYGYDGAGSVRQLTDPAGAVTDTYEYDAFGNKNNSTGTTPNEFLYRGEQFDADLGLYYLRARYYNPLSGRFMSRDPDEECDCSSIPEAAKNKYVYASSDPVNRVDPSGRADAVQEEEIISDIDLQQVGRKTVPKGEFWGGIGLIGLGLEIACQFNTDAAAVRAVGQNLFTQQNLQILPAICSAISGSESGTGPEPGPGTGPSGAPGPPPGREPPPPPKKCPEQHPDWPVNYVHLSATPLIAAHIATAQTAGWPDGLTYLGPNNPLQDVNRKAACPRGTYAGTGMECDEYPYASTVQGGAGASTAPVPPREQRIQGAQLRGFYANLGAGQNFCVEVVP
jgi:RHS repeat-associated protein